MKSSSQARKEIISNYFLSKNSLRFTQTSTNFDKNKPRLVKFMKKGNIRTKSKRRVLFARFLKQKKLIFELRRFGKSYKNILKNTTFSKVQSKHKKLKLMKYRFKFPLKIRKTGPKKFEGSTKLMTKFSLKRLNQIKKKATFYRRSLIRRAKVF